MRRKKGNEMKAKNKNIFLRVAAAILTATLVLSMSVSCSKTEAKEIPDPVLECGEEKLPLYFYEFMLSRIKGSLARNEYDVTSLDFWNSIIGESGKTYEQYYNEAVLESCKNYLAAAVLFDREGLTLSRTASL